MTEIRYVVFRERLLDGTTMNIAACLDYDILAEGKNFSDAIDRLKLTVESEIQIGDIERLKPAVAVLSGSFPRPNQST